MGGFSDLKLPTVEVETTVSQETITALIIAVVLMIAMGVLLFKLAK